eukprot:788208_1
MQEKSIDSCSMYGKKITNHMMERNKAMILFVIMKFLLKSARTTQMQLSGCTSHALLWPVFDGISHQTHLQYKHLDRFYPNKPILHVRSLKHEQNYMSRHVQWIALFLSCLFSLVPAPGGGGGYGGYDSYRGDRYRTSRDGLTCGETGRLVGLIVIVLVLSCFVSIILFVLSDCKADSVDGTSKNTTKHKQQKDLPPTAMQWLQKDVEIIPMMNPEYTEEGAEHDNMMFKNGQYSGFYKQYGAVHDIPPFELHFDATNKTVSGGGWEEVGKYKIVGEYNPLNGRIAMAQIFQIGTGNPRENLGHTVYIRLQWYPPRNAFTGKWYCKTHKYQGSGYFWVAKIK